jgi:hypothetical protein
MGELPRKHAERQVDRRSTQAKHQQPSLQYCTNPKSQSTENSLYKSREPPKEQRSKVAFKSTASPSTTTPNYNHSTYTV